MNQDLDNLESSEGWQTRKNKEILENIVMSPEFSGLKDKGEGRMKVVIASPDTLYGHLAYPLAVGIQIVAEEVYKGTDSSVDISAMPIREDIDKIKDGELLTLFNNYKVKDADIVGISVSNPQVFIDSLLFMDKSGIPHLAKERELYKDALVVGGGLGVTNPLPFSPFYDVLVIGEGAKAMKEIVKSYEKHKKKGSLREVLYEDLSNIEGVFVPEKPKKTEFQKIKQEDYDKNRRASLFFGEEGPLIFTDYSCKFKCGFCQMSNARGDYNYMPEEMIKEYLKEFDALGVKEVTLASATITNYPTEKLKDILEWSEKNLKTANPVIRSVRIDKIDELIEYFHQEKFHIAPESCERLRGDKLFKTLKDEDLYKNLEKVVERGVKKVKAFHLVGVPTETEEERIEYGKMIVKISEMLSKHHEENGISIYMYPVLPQPGTPYENKGVLGVEKFQQYAGELKEYLDINLDKRTKLKLWRLPREAHLLQGLLNTGTAQEGRLVYESYINSRYKSKQECRTDYSESIITECEKRGINTEEYIESRIMGEKAWKHIVLGNENLIERKKARILGEK